MILNNYHYVYSPRIFVSNSLSKFEHLEVFEKFKVDKFEILKIKKLKII